MSSPKASSLTPSQRRINDLRNALKEEVKQTLSQANVRHVLQPDEKLRRAKIKYDKVWTEWINIQLELKSDPFTKAALEIIEKQNDNQMEEDSNNDNIATAVSSSLISKSTQKRIDKCRDSLVKIVNKELTSVREKYKQAVEEFMNVEKRYYEHRDEYLTIRNTFRDDPCTVAIVDDLEKTSILLRANPLYEEDEWDEQDEEESEDEMDVELESDDSDDSFSLEQEEEEDGQSDDDEVEEDIEDESSKNVIETENDSDDSSQQEKEEEEESDDNDDEVEGDSKNSGKKVIEIEHDSDESSQQEEEDRSDDNGDKVERDSGYKTIKKVLAIDYSSSDDGEEVEDYDLEEGENNEESTFYEAEENQSITGDYASDEEVIHSQDEDEDHSGAEEEEGCTSATTKSACKINRYATNVPLNVKVKKLPLDGHGVDGFVMHRGSEYPVTIVGENTKNSSKLKIKWIGYRGGKMMDRTNLIPVTPEKIAEFNRKVDEANECWQYQRLQFLERQERARLKRKRDEITKFSQKKKKMIEKMKLTILEKANQKAKFGPRINSDGLDLITERREGQVIVEKDRLIYFTRDNDTPKLISMMFNVSVERVLYDNRVGVLKRIKRNSSFCPYTPIVLPPRVKDEIQIDYDTVCNEKVCDDDVVNEM